MSEELPLSSIELASVFGGRGMIRRIGSRSDGAADHVELDQGGAAEQPSHEVASELGAQATGHEAKLDDITPPEAQYGT